MQNQAGRNNMQKRFVLLIAVAASFFSTTAFCTPEPSIKIGILATVGRLQSLDIFSGTLDRLEASLDRPIEVAYYDIAGLKHAVDAHELDFFISNAGFFSTAQSCAKARHLATLKIKEAVDPNESMAGVFFVRSDSRVQTIEDMKHRPAAAVSPTAFGGYFVPLGELAARGQNPERFFSSVVFTGYPMQLVFDEVRSGKVQIGLARACLLEEMIRAGRISPDEFRVVEDKRDDKLACSRSTDLYPDWVFAAAPKANPEISRRTAAALLSMPEEDGVYWSIATDFRRIDELYRILKVEHYAYLRSPTISEAIEIYKTELILIIAASIFAAVHYLLVNIEVKRKTQSLREASIAKEEAQRRMYQLEKATLTGVLSNSVAHELKQPISAIANYADGIRQLNASSEVDRSMIDYALEEIIQQTRRAGDVIEHVRQYAKNQAPVKEVLNLREAACGAASEINALIHSMPSIENRIPSNMLVLADRIELSLVLINLMKNSAEALKDDPEGLILLDAVHENGFIRLSVSDNGPVCDPSKFQNVYDLKSSSKNDGLGLGLAVSARMIERIGGGMIIEAVEPHGVRVVLNLPSPRDEENEEPSRSNADGPI